MKKMVIKYSSLAIFCLAIYVPDVFALDLSENEIDDQDTHHPHPKYPASELPLEVDILKLTNVSGKDAGVSVVGGPIDKYPAYKFRLPYGNVPLSNSTSVINAMTSSHGFTVIFLYRQQRNNLGTFLSINSPGRLTPWFQLTSNSKTGILSMKYKLEFARRLRQFELSLPRHHRKSPLAAWTWLAVSVDYTDNLIRVDTDCNPSIFEHLSANKWKKSKIGMPPNSLVYFRQEPGRKKKFLGSMQVAKILPYVTQKRMWQCLEISSNLPPEHQKPLL